MFVHIFISMGIILSIIGMGFILIDVVPVQIREFPKADHPLIRKMLPVLTLSFVFFASLTTLYFINQFIHDTPIDFIRNLVRFIILLSFFITGLGWKIIYQKG